jgi:cytochrome P450
MVLLFETSTGVSSAESWINPYSSAIVLGAVGLCVGCWLLLVRSGDTNRQRLPPAPKNMGLFHFLAQLLGPNGPQFALHLARQPDIGGYIYRTPGLRLLYPGMMIGDPTIGRQILEDPRSSKPFISYQAFDKAASGPTFFPRNGRRANHVRKSTAAAFASHHVNKKRMADIVQVVIEEWITTRLEPLYVLPGKPIDFDEEMMLVTTDVIARAAFDYHELSYEERMEFAENMRHVLKVFFHQGLAHPIRKFMGGFFFPEVRAAQQAACYLKTKFGHRFIQHCRDNHRNADTNSVVYLMLQDEEYQNDDERASDILLYFFAGFETTAHTIAWTMLELARHPKEQTKLRKALSDFQAATARDKNSGNNNSKERTALDENNNILQCPELKHVTREVLRLHTAAAFGSSSCHC